MEPYASDFEADVEFEQYVLAKLVPIVSAAVKQANATIYLDGRPGCVELFLSETAGMSAADFVESSGLRPILFASAWKMVDRLIEHELWKSPDSWKKRYPISEKVAAARDPEFGVDPFRTLPGIWKRVGAAYASSEEYRHSITHRRVTVDSTGAFVGEDKSNVPIRPLSIDEQLAFCKAVQRVATAVIKGAIDSREQSALSLQLDTLCSLTGMPRVTEPTGANLAPIVTFPILKSEIVNMIDVKKRVTDSFLGAYEADIFFHVTDDPALKFFARLEDIPDVTITLDESTFYPWIDRV